MWDAVHRQMPWGIILLLGGGFALADGAETSCLSHELASRMIGLGSLDKRLLLLAVCAMMMVVTQLVSNTASAAMLMPVLREMTLQLRVSEHEMQFWGLQPFHTYIVTPRSSSHSQLSDSRSKFATKQVCQ